MDMNDPEVVASLSATAANLALATEMLRGLIYGQAGVNRGLEAAVAELEESVYGRPVPPKARLSLVSTDEGD
jgi:hypothetical protein